MISTPGTPPQLSLIPCCPPWPLVLCVPYWRHPWWACSAIHLLEDGWGCAAASGVLAKAPWATAAPPDDICPSCSSVLYSTPVISHGTLQLQLVSEKAETFTLSTGLWIPLSFGLSLLTFSGQDLEWGITWPTKIWPTASYCHHVQQNSFQELNKVFSIRALAVPVQKETCRYIYPLGLGPILKSLRSWHGGRY